MKSAGRRMVATTSSGSSSSSNNNTCSSPESIVAPRRLLRSSSTRRRILSSTSSSSSTTTTSSTTRPAVKKEGLHALSSTTDSNNDTTNNDGPPSSKRSTIKRNTIETVTKGDSSSKKKKKKLVLAAEDTTAGVSTNTTASSTDDASTKSNTRKRKSKQRRDSDETKKRVSLSSFLSSPSSGLDPKNLLLDLGHLVKGRLIQRPSASIRSPYVSDVLLLEDEDDDDGKDNDNNKDNSTNSKNKIVQAHSPALDVGGLCVPGTLVYLKERNQPGGGGGGGSGGGGTKTSHSIQLILAPAPHCAMVDHKDVANTGVLVGVHPQLGEQLAQSALSKGLLQDVIGYGPATLASQSQKRPSRQPAQLSSQQGSKVVLYRQCTRGDSRVDFELVEYSSSTAATTTRTTHTTSTTMEEPITDPDPAATLPRTKSSLIEVKNVVCSDVKADLIPLPATTDNHNNNNNNNNKKKKNNNNNNISRHACIIPSHTEPYTRSAIFPWGRRGQTFEGTKVVSERAIKHLRNLANLSSPSQDKNVNDTAKKNDYNVNGIVLFVINRSDCQSMRACHEACPMFAKELKIASEKGCIVTSFRVHWTMDGKAYFDGIVPVTLSIMDS